MASDADTSRRALAPLAAISQAVEILVAQHGVAKIDAFEMLVQGSLLSRVTVRERAVGIIDAARQVS